MKRSVITKILLCACWLVSCTKDPVTDPGGGSGGGTGGGGTGGGGTGGGGTQPPTKTVPSTTFLASQDYSVSAYGAYSYQQFSITTTTTFFFRLASSYKVQAGIFVPSQLSNFTSMQSFTAFGLFNNQHGTQTVTLSPGTYYLGVRNTNTGTLGNKWSWELDNIYTFPASDRVSFYDTYFQTVNAQPTGGKFWQGITIQNGFRYFIDGCSVNAETYIIPENELSNFQNNLSFQYYTDYYMATGAGPGMWEVNLPAGNYYLVGKTTAGGAWTYTGDRWRVN